MATARALEIIAQVRTLLQELNSLAKTLPLADRVANDIFEYYFFGSAGGPGGAKQEIIPVVPKVATWPDRPQGNNWEFSRIGARNRGTPERMIWEFYPPQNPAEREEMSRRIREADAKALPRLSAEEQILQRAARYAAKRANTTPEALLADPAWVKQQQELQQALKKIKILY